MLFEGGILYYLPWWDWDSWEDWESVPVVPQKHTLPQRHPVIIRKKGLVIAHKSLVLSVVVGPRFELGKAKLADLQSAPVGHLGNLPHLKLTRLQNRHFTYHNGYSKDFKCGEVKCR